MKRIGVLLFAMLDLAIIRAQSGTPVELDSLHMVWSDASRADTIRFNALQRVLQLRRFSSPPDSLLPIADVLIAFARAHGMKADEASAQNFRGIFLKNLGQWDSSEASYLRSYRIYEELGDSGRMASCLNNLGNVASYKDDVARSIDYLTRSLRLGEQAKDSSVIARALGNIGVSYYEQHDYEQALDFFKRRVAVADAIGDEQCALEAWINIGMTQDMLGDREQARAGYERSLQLARRLNDVTSIYSALNNLGRLDVAADQHERGLARLDSSLLLAERDGDQMGMASALTEMARSHLLQGHIATALTLSERALVNARSTGTLEATRDASDIRYQVLKAAGRASEALAMHEFYVAVRDSFANDENRRSIMQQKFQYDYDKKEALLTAEQEKKDAIATEELRLKNAQRNAFIGGFGLMVLLAGVFFVQRNRINKEKKRSEELLLNILPEEVAEELKAKGSAEAVHIDQVTVLFTDFKGFTAMSEVLSPRDLVRDLHECFSAFDLICGKYGIEKIKTIGDAYMAAGGLPTPNTTHATDVIMAAFEMRDFIAEGKAHKIAAGLPYFEIRIGIHTGPVVAGIVGVKKFQYDIWGDTVNTASRMESSGEVGHVNISEATYALVKDAQEVVNGHNPQPATRQPVTEPAFTFTPRGKVLAKGKGEMEMYFVERS